MMRLRLSLFLVFVCLIVFGCGGSGGSSTTATTGTTGPGKWTVLVYMNAANNLYPDSDLNMIQMQKAAGNPLVRMVVQWKQTKSLYPQSSFDGTRRYLVRPSTGNSVVSQVLQDMAQTVDMGDPQSLSDFIAWGKANFPADHYLLILWDHGNGWRMKMKQAPLGRAFSYDDQTQHAIQIWSLQSALGTQQFDTIVWDCSLMQMAEVDYQIRANTRWTVSSEESPPEQGYPYDVALAKYRDFPNDTPQELAKSWVDSMLADPLYPTRNIEESLVDTTQLTAVSNAVDGLAGQLIANNGSLSTLTQSIRANGQSYDETVSPPRYFFDLTDIATRYKAGTPDANVDAACTTAINAVAAAVFYEKHNTHSPGSHGLSIDFTPGSAFNANGLGQYLLLDFGKANRWAQWLTIAP